MLVILQPARKKIADKEDDLIIKASQMTLLDRRVVLIDDDDRRCAVKFVEHLGKHLQRNFQIIPIGCTINDTQIVVIVSILLRIIQLGMPLEFHGNVLGNAAVRLGPAFFFHVLKADENDRIFTLKGSILFSARPDFFILEVN